MLHAGKGCWFALVVAACAGPACIEPVSVPEPPAAHALSKGETGNVTLLFRRFDVVDFRQTVTLADLRAMPRATLERTWLFDLDLTPLITSVLERFTAMAPAEAYALPLPARNLWRLLNMTPASADLSGSKLAPLLEVGRAVGFPPPRILADLLVIDENTPLSPAGVTAQAVLDTVVASHPNARTRRGPVSSSHPDGLYPVAPRSIPVSLADVADNFASLAARFGPAALDPAHPDRPVHPGFLRSASGIVATQPDFAMTVHVNLDALPYEGVDMSSASVARVNSVPSQIATMFDFQSPSWLELRGLAEELVIGEMTMTLYEDPEYVSPGIGRDPAPFGSSPVWKLPPWRLERVMAETARLEAAQIPAHCTAYAALGQVPSPHPFVDVCIDATSFTSITVDPSVVLAEPAPAPSYFWDVFLDVAEARMHDGGLPEGDADVQLTARDVPIGLSTAEIVETIRRNVQASPESLTELSVRLNDTSEGDADFYHYMPSAGEAAGADYLYFTAPIDVRRGPDGEPVRPYAYRRPGFFADPELTVKLSTKARIDGDAEHEKLRVMPGMVIYAEDDDARRYAVHVGDKPSPHRISLTVTRID